MSDGKIEVTLTITMTHTEWCEAYNGLCTAATRKRDEYRTGSVFEEGECHCGAKGDPEKCKCYELWAQDLQNAADKIQKVCEENGVTV